MIKHILLGTYLDKYDRIKFNTFKLPFLYVNSSWDQVVNCFCKGNLSHWKWREKIKLLETFYSLMDDWEAVGYYPEFLINDFVNMDEDLVVRQ